MRSCKFDFQLDRRSKIYFTFPNVYVSWIKCDKVLISQLSPLKFKYFVDLDNFQIEKWISQTEAQNVDNKNKVICLASFLASCVIVLKLPKIVHILQNCADPSKKCKYMKAIYLYPSERPCHALSENIIFYRGLSNSSQNIEE